MSAAILRRGLEAAFAVPERLRSLRLDAIEAELRVAAVRQLRDRAPERRGRDVRHDLDPPVAGAETGLCECDILIQITAPCDIAALPPWRGRGGRRGA